MYHTVGVSAMEAYSTLAGGGTDSSCIYTVLCMAIAIYSTVGSPTPTPLILIILLPNTWKWSKIEAKIEPKIATVNNPNDCLIQFEVGFSHVNCSNDICIIGP